MRTLPLWILALSSTMLTAACSPEFDAAEQENKKEIIAEKSDLQQRLAMASESAGDLAAAERIHLKLAEGGGTQAQLDLAGFYLRNNQPQRAADILEKAYASDHGNMDLMRTYANALISSGKASKALAMLDAAIAEGITSAYMYNSRGVALDTLGRYGQAQQSYRKAIELNPSDTSDFQTNLSMSYILSGEYYKAIELLEPLVSSKRAAPQARQNLALAYGLAGDMDKAMDVGSKDVSIKEMRENIRFYQHIADRKGNTVSKPAPALEPAQSRPVIAEEDGELPPAPPPPVRNLTQPVSPPPQASPVAAKATPPEGIASAVAPQPEPAKVKLFTPVPEPVPATVMPPSAPPSPVVQHKMLTTAPTESPASGEKAASEPAQEKAEHKLKPSDRVQASEEGSDTAATTEVKSKEPAALMNEGAIPTPVLKPDNW